MIELKALYHVWSQAASCRPQVPGLRSQVSSHLSQDNNPRPATCDLRLATCHQFSNSRAQISTDFASSASPASRVALRGSRPMMPSVLFRRAQRQDHAIIAR